MTIGLPSVCGGGYDGALGDSGPGADWPGAGCDLAGAEPGWVLAASETEWRADLLRAGGSAGPGGDAGGAGRMPGVARAAGPGVFADAARVLGLFDPALLAREATGGAAAGF